MRVPMITGAIASPARYGCPQQARSAVVVLAEADRRTLVVYVSGGGRQAELAIVRPYRRQHATWTKPMPRRSSHALRSGKVRRPRRACNVVSRPTYADSRSRRADESQNNAELFFKLGNQKPHV